jgi:hypothetical protein
VGYSNPYNDVTLSVTYTGPSGQNIQTYGFWDGGDTFRIRFMFPEVGQWTWETDCSDVTNNGLHGQSGAVDVVDYVGGNPLYTKGYPAVSDDNRYLVYADGSPFFWFADTAYSAPMNATQAEWESYVDNRRDKRFNVIELLIGRDVSDAEDTVDIYGNGPFLGSSLTDLSSWNPAFWQEYERKVQYANDQGIIIVIQGVATPTREREPMNYELPELLRFAQNLVARFLGNFVVCTGIWDYIYREEGNAVGLAMRQTSALHLISQHPTCCDFVPGDDENHAIETAERYYDQPYLNFSGLQSGAGWTKVPYLFVNDLAAKNAIEWTQLLYNHNPHKPVINLEAIYDSSVRHDPDDPYHTEV